VSSRSPQVRNSTQYLYSTLPRLACDGCSNGPFKQLLVPTAPCRVTVIPHINLLMDVFRQLDYRSLKVQRPPGLPVNNPPSHSGQFHQPYCLPLPRYLLMSTSWSLVRASLASLALVLCRTRVPRISAFGLGGARHMLRCY
jgi:hypothetical protein